MEFIQNKNVHFVFLLRNPHESLISFYKKSRSCPAILNYIIGYEPFYNIVQKVKMKSTNKLTVILTEDLCGNPEKVIKEFCDSLSIPFIPESLHWSSEDQIFDYQKGWHEIKTNEAMQIWHGEAIKSSSFGKLNKYSVDEEGNPTFEEIIDPEHKETYKLSYLYNLKFYRMLLDDADFQALIHKSL